MMEKRKDNPGKGFMLTLVVIINVIIIKAAFTSDAKWYYLLLLSLPAAVAAILDIRRDRARP